MGDGCDFARWEEDQKRDQNQQLRVECALGLKPCPFCGKPANLLHEKSGKFDWYLATCGDIECNGGPGIRYMRRNKSHEIDAWNSRKP